MRELVMYNETCVKKDRNTYDFLEGQNELICHLQNYLINGL